MSGIRLRGSSIVGVVVAATIVAWGPAEAAGTVTVAPTNLSFPATYVGDTSTMTVTVTNTGGSDVTPNFAGGAPNDPTNFGGSQNCAGITLSPGATCSFTYTFKPATAGQHSSSTTIGVDSDNFSISMQGTGLAPISISQTSLTFPDTPVGATSSIDIVVRNDSPVSQTPNYAGGAPNDPTNFGGSQNCAGVTLPAGGTCQFTYTFTPTTTGPLSSTTTITVDSSSFAITMAGNGTDPTATTTTTTTTTISPPTTATTTTTPGTSSATSAASAGTSPSTVATPAGTVVAGPGPLSDGGDAFVIAQGIVEFTEGTFGWDGELLDLSGAPFTFDQSPSAFLAATGDAPLLVRADGASAALLDRGEAAFVAAASSGDLTSASPDGTGSALRVTFVAGSAPFSFSPGPGRRDVNLVAATLRPGEGLHVVSPFPVLVAVLAGAVHDAPENTEVGAGSMRAFNDADLSNQGAEPAEVLIAAVGSPVP